MPVRAPKSMPPTIRELAKLAGVSRTTVSMALRNSPRISSEVRERIIRLAAEMGYQRDPVVSALMNQLRVTRTARSAERIAYLTFWDTPNDWRKNANEIAYFNGARERAAHLGYELEAFWAREPGISAARLGRILQARGIRGVLIAPLPRGLGHVSLDCSQFACAALSLTVLRPNFHRASHDYHGGMQLALHSLKKLGYRRPGFANMAVFEQRTNHGWLSGYLTYQFRTPSIGRIPPLLMPGLRHHDEWDRKTFAKWLEKWQPDVILCNTEQPLHLCRELGYKVPRDIGFASLHKLRPEDPWAGIDRQSLEIGSAGVDLVVSQLQNNEFGLPSCARTVFINSLWREGPTVQSMTAPKASARAARKPPAKAKKARRRG